MLALPFMRGLNPLLKGRQIMAAHFKRELAPDLNSFQARSKAKGEYRAKTEKRFTFVHLRE